MNAAHVTWDADTLRKARSTPDGLRNLLDDAKAKIHAKLGNGRQFQSWFIPLERSLKYLVIAEDGPQQPAHW